MNNNIQPRNYVRGLEEHREIKREMRGWVDRVSGDKVFIQADDEYGGNRGTMLDLNTVNFCNKVEDWQIALKRTIPVGSVVRHFKNKLYKIIGYGNNVDGGQYVIYESLYDNPHKVWLREYSEFMSEVDRKKYPEIKQKYRFEEVEHSEEQ